MSNVHVHGTGTCTIWFQCLPDAIHRSELLDAAGTIKRKNKMKDLKASLGPGNPVLAQFDEITPPQGPRFVLVHFDGAGPVDIRIRTHNAEPPIEVEDWETIEQVGAEFGELENTAQLDDSNTKDTPPDLDTLMKQIPPGWNMIRAHRRRSHTPESGSDVLIDIWPIAGPSGQKHIKHQPVVPENPKVPPRADEYQQWVRITRCLRRAGAASIADRAMGQPAVIAESVISALKNAGLNPRETPTQWFHILTQYPDHRWADLLPDYRLLTVEQALKTREQALRISPKTHDYPRAAGEPTQTYIPEYIPIAENATHILIYDSRHGDKHGLIREFDKISGVKTKPEWKNLVYLLGALAFALENRTPFRGFTPQLTDRNLRWQPK